MTKMILSIVLVLALIFGYAAAKPMAHDLMSLCGDTSEVSKLLGTLVRNPRGEDLGIITDVVKGPEGCVAFAVLSYLISDDTQKRVAAFSVLSCEEQNCVLNASRETFDSAPLLFQRMIWLSLNWLKTSTDISVYNRTGQRKEQRNKSRFTPFMADQPKS